MAGHYENPISIKEAIDAINGNDFLLPAIQRKFEWKSSQICALFDSLMRGYPINTFMLWEVRDKDVKNDYKFYTILKEYCERFKEENPSIATNAAFKDFNAIIDGQQRLTSLYIGLCGTYAYKRPRVWWPTSHDERILPPRKLYLDLLRGIQSEDEDRVTYNFRFLSDAQYAQSMNSNGERENHWFCLHEILRFSQYDEADKVLMKIVIPELQKIGLAGNEFASETLLKLYTVVRNAKVIHYFKEKEQKPDHILDVFIRTNSGGTPLSFSTLLVSIAVANWNGDFRNELDALTKLISQSQDMGFYIERDWILKTTLMLTDADIRFKVKNFGAPQVDKIQTQWPEMKECILKTFRFIRRCGINVQSLTSKNAVMPICYYLYKKQYDGQPLYKTIDSLARHGEEYKNISKWLYMVLLKGTFGVQSDTILEGMRAVLDENMTVASFPLQQIVDKYVGQNKDLRFDDAYLDRLLDTRYGDARCRPLLHLIHPEKDAMEIFDVDHLHSQDEFKPANLKKHEFLSTNVEKYDFYVNPAHWNSLPNLYLLNDSLNRSKGASPLADWLASPDARLSAANLSVDTEDLPFDAFPVFYAKRRAEQKKRLRTAVFITTTALHFEVPATDELDEEVTEESNI
ncbi:MAG: DUF262 domain-containing protein [Deltaproteobacteria bacterium]|jgi:hypothetical protein|nr:DUF262 domain-containing protein [Deltaproteobacteria bacterium]